MNLEALVAELDEYFRVREVAEETDWQQLLDFVYHGDSYWRDYVDPFWIGFWKGLMVRGADEVERVATCVFPSDAIFARLEPRTLLFTEHPVDHADAPGFLPWSRASFELMRERGISVYAVHWPLDVHPDVGPSKLCADGVGLEHVEPFLEGAAVVGDSAMSLEGLAETLRVYLGDDVKVHVLTRPRQEAGRVAIAAGGAAMCEVLEAALERGCETYVTGNAATNCVLDFVQASVREFRALAEQESVALIDAMHYGTEKPPQFAMVEWFRARGLQAEFVTDGAK